MRRTLVYGLGESGIAASRVLMDAGEAVFLADKNDNEELRKSLENLGSEGVLGAGPDILEGISRIVVSPGISPKDEILAEAESRGIPIVSEAAFGLATLGGGIRVAAVTGTNGKTTVVDMLRSILEASEVPHTVAGNSWRALCGCLEEARKTGTLVLELSSFQLHYMESPGFGAAALLNVRPDHLNWHTSFEEYIEDKLRIFDGQGEHDLALVSAGDEIGAAPSLSAETVVVGGGETAVRDGKLFLRGEEIAEESEFSFAGIHNHENALFAAEMARKLGAPLEGVRAGLLGYRLKPHRMEVVAESGGVLWMDDSKATNPAAAAAALGSFRRPVVLILGGSEKDTDFAEVLPALDVCRAVVCQGEAGPRIFEYLKSEGFGGIACLVDGLSEAVEKSASLAEAGDVVLLSPGCASFDAFAGYAERGGAFARMARNVSSERGAVGG